MLSVDDHYGKRISTKTFHARTASRVHHVVHRLPAGPLRGRDAAPLEVEVPEDPLQHLAEEVAVPLRAGLQAGLGGKGVVVFKLRGEKAI